MHWRDYEDVKITSEYDTAGPGKYGRIINYERFVETADGRRFNINKRKSAIALATLFEVLDRLKPSEKKDGFVPTRVAVRGQPAIATYLVGVHEFSVEETAEVMDVNPGTVEKYLSRFKPYTSSGK